MEYEPMLTLFQGFEPLFGSEDLYPDPYPHQGDKSNPDPHPDPHTDPHLIGADPQHFL